jgi:hypothetical protein
VTLFVTTRYRGRQSVVDDKRHSPRARTLLIITSYTRKAFGRLVGMPPATSYRRRVRLIRNNFRNARCDHPSVTLALIPSALRRKRTARSERPKTLRDLVHWFIAGQVQQLRIVLRKPGT